MQSLTFALLAGALLGTVVSAQAAEPHGFNVHDLLAMERISEPQPSPDGQWVAFTVRTTDLEANKGRTDLWRVGIDGKNLQQLTTHDASDTTPAWSPDGAHLYFLSSRSGSSQVWRLPMAGGEAQQITELPVDVGGYLIAPDGKSLAFTADVFTDCADLKCTADRLEAKGKEKTSGQLYDQLFVRHWDTWKDGRRGQLFVVPISSGAAAGGDAVWVSRGLTADIPSKPFGGMEEVTFSPDSKTLVFSARTADKSEAWSTDFDLWTVPADGSAAPKNLTPDNGALITQPRFSPDGKTLAFLAMSRPGYEADRLRLRVMDWPGGAPKTVAEEWDRSIGSYLFSPDGTKIYATAGDTGNVPLVSIDLATDAVTKLVADGTVRSPAAAGDRIVFGLENLRMPTELFSIAADGSDRKQLTDVNAKHLEGVQMGEPEQFHFAGANDDTVYGWVVKPAGFVAGKKYPVAFMIHGGPQGSFNNNFHYRWNPQTYTGAGYAVVMVDFHGSTGYGQAFTDAIGKDWGGKPLVDLQKGLAAAIDQYSFLDGDRVGALGASYGGFMINWIAGNWPDRFRCLINHDGIFDQRMMYYATEELWFPEWEQGGPYYQSPELYERSNPAHFVEKWQTPMLVVHGALDYRVPLTQGLATFTALQRRGIPSELLVFPDENHWVLKPANSIQWHDTVIGWLDRWVKADS